MYGPSSATGVSPNGGNLETTHANKCPFKMMLATERLLSSSMTLFRGPRLALDPGGYQPNDHYDLEELDCPQPWLLGGNK